MRAESENGPYSWIASVGGTSYTDQGLKTGQTYYYKIYASALLDGTWYNGALSSPVPGEALRAPASVPVSYTHLDVYKRQVYGSGKTRDWMWEPTGTR